MPGGRGLNFRFGDNAELLAEFLLNNLAFTTRVPRQEDVGHDLICAIAKPEGPMLLAGAAFTVQIKTSMEPIAFEKPYQQSWLKSQELPMFLCVVNRELMEAELYSTWNLLNGILSREAKRILLVPGGPNDQFELPRTDDKGEEQIVPLGKPVIRMSVSDVITAERIGRLRQVLEGWIGVDAENIINRRAGMYWVGGPVQYETNEPLVPPRTWHLGFFFHPHNLQKCAVNCLRSATALRLVLKQTFGQGLEYAAELPGDRMRTLDAFLRAHSDVLEPLARQVLLDHLGGDFLGEPTNPPGSTP